MADLSKYIEDEETAAPTDDQLVSIEAMVQRSLELSRHISALEDALDAATKEYREIMEHELVDRLTAAGTSYFKTTAGLGVEIKSDLVVSEIKSPEKRRELAAKRAEWLEKNGGESLIQESVEMIFDKGAHDRAVAIMQTLKDRGYDFVHGNNINTGSFKAFVRDIMHEDVEVPFSDLGLYQKREAKITLPVERKSRRRT